MTVRIKEGFPDVVKDRIWDRAQSCCEKCGRGLLRTRKGSFEIHHRRPRGNGGTSLGWVNEAANGLLLCPGCHRWIENNRKAAYLAGWLIHNGIDVADQIPINHAVLGRVLLQNDGSYTRANQEREEWTA